MVWLVLGRVVGTVPVGVISDLADRSRGACGVKEGVDSVKDGLDDFGDEAEL